MFICLAVWTSRIFATGHQKMHGRFMKGHFKTHVLPFGVLLDLLAFGGLYFFEEGCVTFAVTADRYATHPDMWFQQDGATAHTARNNGRFKGNVSKTRYLVTWRRWVTCAFTRSGPVRFFPLGLPESKGFSTPSPNHWQIESSNTLRNYRNIASNLDSVIFKT